MITKNTIDQIFGISKVEEVIGDFVALKKSGSNFKGLSPFSDEKTPSFVVSPSKQIWKDFSSGKGGNVVSFLMEHEHLTYPEALKYLAKKYNITIEEDQNFDAEKNKEEQSLKESLFIVSDLAKKYFEETLWKSDEGRSVGLSYFKERGFTDEIIEKFNLGYNPKAWSSFTEYAIEKGYSKEILEKSGLTILKNESAYDRFRERVIFPIHSFSGRILGFGGRILTNEKKKAKYVNSPESEIYEKSKILYGIYLAKPFISKEDKCYLVEGYTDVISFYQAGIKNVVATSGTALTPNQIRLIKRLTPNLTIVYDGDQAGIKAAERAVDLGLEQEMNLRVVLLPEGQDPDTLAKSNTKEELDGFLKENENDFIHFLLELLTSKTEANSLERSTGVFNILKSLAKIEDIIKREHYIRQISSSINISEKALFSQLSQIDQKNRRDKKKEEKRQQFNQREPLTSIQSQVLKLENSWLYHFEKEIIRLLLNFGEESFYVKSEENEEENIKIMVSDEVFQMLQEDDLELKTPIFNQIFSEYFSLKQNEEYDPMYFLQHEKPEVSELAANMLIEKHQLHNWEQQNIFVLSEVEKLKDTLYQTIFRYKRVRISMMIDELTQSLKNPQEETVVETLKEIQTLQGLKRMIDESEGLFVNFSASSF